MTFQAPPTNSSDERRWRVLALMSLATILALSVWFSTNAIGPALEEEKGFSDGDLAWLTISVQLGFVFGTLVSAVSNLADMVNARKLFAVSAVLAGVANLAVIPLDSFVAVLAVRFVTGAFLAGVYPPAMKVLAGWFKEGRGIALGVMIGALTIGSGSPHLLRSIFIDNWEASIVGGSILAIAGGLVVPFGASDGPYDVPGAKFNPRYLLRVVTQRDLRLTLFGYMGHMWELYAMWAWIGAYFATIYGTRTVIGGSLELAGVLAFAVFLAGAVTSAAAGLFAERWGRTLATSGLMIVSGAMAFSIGFLPEEWTVVIALFALVWGGSVVADSAQFSTAATELSEDSYRGTVLTFQTGLGFAITAVSIRLVPVIEDAAGWGVAFAILGVGPVLGTFGMLRLRSLPESARLAGGRR